MINNISDCTIEMYDKASRGDLNVLRGDDKQANEKQLYDAFIEITDQFNDKMDSSEYRVETETAANTIYLRIKIDSILLAIECLNLIVDNPAFGKDDMIEIVKSSLERGGVSWIKNDFGKMLKKAHAKLSYYQNQIEANKQKIEGMKSTDESESESSIYSLVALMRVEGTTIDKSDSLLILAETDNLSKKIKKQKNERN
jgi:hypothetical protein